jgi:hypothetical protein
MSEWIRKNYAEIGDAKTLLKNNNKNISSRSEEEKKEEKPKCPQLLSARGWKIIIMLRKCVVLMS